VAVKPEKSTRDMAVPWTSDFWEPQNTMVVVSGLLNFRILAMRVVRP